MPVVFSTIAAAATACFSAFMFFWAALCFIYGGPDGQAGNEALLAGLVSTLAAFAAAFATKVLYVAPARVEKGDASTLHRLALKTSPLFALVFSVLLGMLSIYMLIYFIIIAAVMLAVRLRWR